MRSAAPPSLHHGVQRRHIHPEDKRDPEHAFIADQAHLQTGAAIDRRDQGNETLRGKINVASALAGFGQDLGKHQLDRLAAGQKTLAILARQGRKQTIDSRGRLGKRHVSAPGGGGNPASGTRRPCNAFPMSDAVPGRKVYPGWTI